MKLLLPCFCVSIWQLIISRTTELLSCFCVSIWQLIISRTTELLFFSIWLFFFNDFQRSCFCVSIWEPAVVLLLWFTIFPGLRFLRVMWPFFRITKLLPCFCSQYMTTNDLPGLPSCCLASDVSIWQLMIARTTELLSCFCVSIWQLNDFQDYCYLASVSVYDNCMIFRTTELLSCFCVSIWQLIISGLPSCCLGECVSIWQLIMFQDYRAEKSCFCVSTMTKSFPRTTELLPWLLCQYMTSPIISNDYSSCCLASVSVYGQLIISRTTELLSCFCVSIWQLIISRTTELLSCFCVSSIWQLIISRTTELLPCFCVSIWQLIISRTTELLSCFCVSIWQLIISRTTELLSCFCVSIWQPVSTSIIHLLPWGYS